MGATKSVPDAYEAVGGTMFNLDFVICSLISIIKTILFTIWIFYAYYNVNIIPVHKQKNIVSRDETSRSPDVSSVQTATTTQKESRTSTTNIDNANSDKIQKTMMCTASKHKVHWLARLFITLSIVSAVLYSYYQVILHTLRYLEIVIDVPCWVNIFNLGWASNRLFLYLFLIVRLNVSFKGTFLAISSFEYKLLVISYCTCAVIGVALYYFFVSFFGCTSFLTLMAFLPLSFFDSIGGLLFLYLFYKKLKKLINLDLANSSIQKIDKKNPAASSDLKYITNKVLIITLFAICWTYLVCTIYLFYGATALATIDTMANVYCLMIMNGNYDLYYQKSCYLCRKCCERSFNSINTEQSKNVQMVIH